jgi:hypothetical protein
MNRILGLAGLICLLTWCSFGHAQISAVIEAPKVPRQLAGQEFTKYIRQMGLERLGLQTADGDLSGRPITHVCRADSPELAKVSPELPKPSAGGYVIAMRGEHLYLVGADDAAMFYAVYDLLYRAGCRWLAPGFSFYYDSNEFVPKLAEAKLDLREDVVSAPALKYRKLYVEEGHSFTAENLRQLIDWMPKLRFNTLVIPTDYQGRGRVRWDNWREALAPELRLRAITVEVGGHGYQNFLNAKMEEGRLFREHPEWFAMDDKGKRTPAPAWVLCSSNPEAVHYLQRNVLAYLKARPEIEIFDFWPPDGAKWCTCPACTAMGSPSQRHALLVSGMAEVLDRELPEVRLECIAYSSYLEPPEKGAIDNRVLVDLCPIRQCFEWQIYEPASSTNADYAAALEQWSRTFGGDVSIYSYYRKYAWSSLPVILPHYVQKDLQWYREHGVKGVSTYSEPGDWFTYELNHYTLGRLAWDPNADVDAIVAEFCDARYGPEASTAREVFAGLEDIVRHACSIPGTSLKRPAEYDAFAGIIEALRVKAANAVKWQGAKPKLVAHLVRLGLMLEYAARDIAIQKARASNAPLEQRKTLVDDLIAFHRKHAEAGVFVFCSRLEADRQYRNYGITAAKK